MGCCLEFILISKDGQIDSNFKRPLSLLGYSGWAYISIGYIQLVERETSSCSLSLL